MKQQTNKQINTATLLPAVKVAKKAPKAKVKPIYEHQQGNCTMPQNEVKQCGLSLVGLPLLTGEPIATNHNILKANHIDKVKLSNAVISNGLQLNMLKPQQAIKTPQTKAKRTSHEYTGKTSQPVQNGVRLPKPETQCGKSWALCDEYYARTGVIPMPKIIGDIGESVGINRNTASSEVSQWRYYHFGRDVVAA